jgi:uncharacterized protein
MISREEALSLLEEVGTPPDVIEHCEAVSQKSVEFAKKLSVPVDLQLVEIGGLLHDIGRSQSHGIDHGVKGGILLRERGLDKLARFAENHIGAGITKDEAARLGLPKKNFLPETLEEKIVTYVDFVTDGAHPFSFSEALRELREQVGNDHPAIHRAEELRRELLVLKN